MIAYQAYHDTLTERVKPSNGKAKLKTDTRFQLIRDWAGTRGFIQ